MNIQIDIEELRNLIQEEIGDSVRSTMKEEMEVFVEDESNVDKLSDTPGFRLAVSNHVSRTLPTMLGNRLRCGCWDNLEVKKIFNEAFDEEFQKQLRSEVRMLAKRMAQEELTKFFEKMTEAAKKAAEFRWGD